MQRLLLCRWLFACVTLHVPRIQFVSSLFPTYHTCFPHPDAPHTQGWPSLVFMVYQRADIADKDSFVSYGLCALPQVKYGWV